MRKGLFAVAEGFAEVFPGRSNHVRETREIATHDPAKRISIIYRTEV